MTLRVDAVLEQAPARKTLLPPPVFLESEAGRQRAAQGASCVLYTAQGPGEGAAICGEVEGHGTPASLSVVRPREPVVISVPGATIVHRRGCVGRHSCGGWATVRRLGCEEEIDSFELRTSSTRWRVDLPAGFYEIDVAIDFRTKGGLSGDTSGAFGISVDPAAKPAIVPAAGRAVCPG